MSENNNSHKDRRQFKRLPFVSKMQLFSRTSAWECEIIDISLKGVLFNKPENWDGKLNDIYRISISLSNSPTISMNIIVAHLGQESIGAKWNKIDVDSFSRLKRLLELNTIERNRITREIGYL